MIAVVLLCVLSLLSHDVYGGARITKRQSQTIISRENMLRGIGGVTVVDVGNPLKQILIRDNKHYICHVKYDITGIPTCSDFPMRYQPKSPADFCFAINGILWNGNLCFPTSDQSSVRILPMYGCRSNDNTPVYLVNSFAYKLLCKRYPWEYNHHFYALPNQNIGNQMGNLNNKFFGSGVWTQVNQMGNPNSNVFDSGAWNQVNQMGNLHNKYFDIDVQNQGNKFFDSGVWNQVSEMWNPNNKFLNIDGHTEGNPILNLNKHNKFFGTKKQNNNDQTKNVNIKCSSYNGVRYCESVVQSATEPSIVNQIEQTLSNVLYSHGGNDIVSKVLDTVGNLRIKDLDNENIIRNFTWAF